ncbi:MAG: hypothetical protein RLP02_30410, partial [Coleofasciculus sp. C2-GNP5-27]
KTYRSPESRQGGCWGKLADCLFIETHVAQKTETGKQRGRIKVYEVSYSARKCLPTTTQN